MKKFYVLFLAVAFLSFGTVLQAANTEKEADNSEYVVQQRGAVLNDALVDGVDGRYKRIYGSPYDGTCNAASNLSGFADDVLYKVYEIHTTVAEAADISLDDLGTGLDDTYMTLYCTFDPNNADQNVFCGDDDGGAGWMSAFTPVDGYMLDANTSYYLVVAGYNNGAEGGFAINMGGNLDFGAPPPPPVPLSNWAFALIGLFALTFVFIKFKK